MTQPRIEMTVHGLALLLCVAIGLLLVTRPLTAQVPPPPIPAAATGDHIDPVAATNAYLRDHAGRQEGAVGRATSRAATGCSRGASLIDAVICFALCTLACPRGSRCDRGSPHSTESRCRPRIVRARVRASPVRPRLFPWSVCTDFIREHQYGLSTQTFGAWMGDTLKGLRRDGDHGSRSR